MVVLGASSRVTHRLPRDIWMRAMGVSQMVLMAVEKPSSSCVIPDVAHGCRSESMNVLNWEVLVSNCETRGWTWDDAGCLRT